MKNLISNLGYCLYNYRGHIFGGHKIYNFLRKYFAEGYLVSFPKCGRTWVRLMIAEYYNYLCHLKVSEEDLIELEPLAFYDNKIPWFVVDHIGDPHRKEKKISSKYFYRESKKRKLSEKKILYLYRDPRDVIVSLFHHFKSRENILPNDVNVNEFVTQSIILDNLIEFYNYFGEEFKSEVFYLTSYERLKHNTKKEMKGIFEVLFEENPNINVLNKAVESCEFEKMQKKEIDHKIKNSRIGDNKNSDGHNSRKVRKGKIGGYRDELEKKTIREINYKLENELSSFYKTEYFHK